ncbi:hypothetical protein DICPUDRAFT_156955 [Dictyostelium purpureum]|uniref:FNIP repeat-containing protein n=1 Tax=Dictyostelium purpureum TaxID=5786 RepID=F0ZXW0_DICPU|nr:uncharacterized protein DICPUDRAFT_156955 [Dictyostelium purpureum]EGC31226.1 hypothetical protein DICPUDRAFT_156955 [Dictyostelium purpureum]|eukprot:XP_003292256.1 hypothetical protein DICPUDRAFT_156955 [Dictyostelium purpureum]
MEDRFLTIWRNIILKKKILSIIRDSNRIESYGRHKQFTIEELRDFSARYYLFYVNLIDDDEPGLSTDYIEPKLIPENTIELLLDLNKKIKEDSLQTNGCSNIKVLKLSRKFKNEINPHCLPSSIEKLIFYGDYNFPIFKESNHSNVLPGNLKYLDLGFGFNQIIPAGCLPNTLVSLKFSRNFNQVLQVKCLPESLQILEIGENYLNKNLEGVEFGDNFNQKELFLNNGLKKLKFNLHFNSNEFLEKKHDGLEWLEFGNAYDKPVDNIMNFKNLKNLKFGFGFNQDIKGLPKRLEHLHLGFRFNQSLNFLKKLKQLRNFTFSKNYESIIRYDQLLNLSSLIELNFSNDFNQSLVILNNGNKDSIASPTNTTATTSKATTTTITTTTTTTAATNTTTSSSSKKKISEGDFKKLLKKNNLKLFKQKLYIYNSQIIRINFGNSFNKRLEKSWLLESGLQEIYIGTSFNNQILQDTLPRQLKKLIFSTSSHFNQEILKDSLPNSIEELQFGYQFNNKLSCKNLPKSLKVLKLLGQFNKPLKDLPEGLQYLEFGNSFCQIILPNQLPSNLSTLIIGAGFSNEPGSISEGVLPDSITFLKFSSDVLLDFKSLPRKLEKFIVQEFKPYYFDKNFLPNSLKWFEIQHYPDSSSDPCFEKTLFLNEGLEVLKINYISIDSINSSDLIQFPSSLKKLIIHIKYPYAVFGAEVLNNESYNLNRRYELPKYCNLILNRLN